MSGQIPANARGHRAVRIVIGAVVALGLVVAYFVVLQGFRAETDQRARPFVSGAEDATEGIDITGTVLSLDPAKGEMAVRMAFAPKGALANNAGELTETVKLLVNSASGNVARTFDKGKLMNPTDVTLSLFNGQVTGYPTDTYDAELNVAMTTAGPNPGEDTLVPAVVNLFAAPHGFTVDLSKSADSPDGAHFLDLHVKRAASTLFFAIFVMVLMWALALGALALAATVTMFGREIQVAMFGFLTALLFAFPAMRNALPGAPPIGSLNDYLAFFWAEGIVAVALVVIVVVWLVRQARAAP